MIGAQSYHFKRKFIYRHRRVIREEMFRSASQVRFSKPPLRGYGDGYINFLFAHSIQLCSPRPVALTTPNQDWAQKFRRWSHAKHVEGLKCSDPTKWLRNSAKNLQESTLCLARVSCLRRRPSSNQRRLSLDKTWLFSMIFCLVGIFDILVSIIVFHML